MMTDRLADAPGGPGGARGPQRAQAVGRWQSAALATVLSCACTVTLSAQTLRVPYETFTLPNGLQVIVHEDHSVPIVTVNTWYHVGSGDERRGRTGFAHLFEHIMFMGSQHVPVGMFDVWLESAGGTKNRSTPGNRTQHH